MLNKYVLNALHEAKKKKEERKVKEFILDIFDLSSTSNFLMKFMLLFLPFFENFFSFYY